MDTRIKTFDSIFNFRDFGGYKTQSQQRIKPEHLFRSAHLNTPSEADLSRLEALDIGLVVDMRHTPERQRQPSQWPKSQSPKILLYPVPDDAPEQAIAPHEAFMQNELNSAMDARNYMHRSYSARPSDVGFQQMFAQTLHHMVETGDKILVHCTAGKDRTGTLVAVIHAALGVDEKTIMDDFMLTMKAVNVDQFLPMAASLYSKRYGREIDPQALRPMFSVEEEYLENAMATIADMDKYIREDLAFSDRDKARLRSLYINDE